MSFRTMSTKNGTGRLFISRPASKTSSLLLTLFLCVQALALFSCLFVYSPAADQGHQLQAAGLQDSDRLEFEAILKDLHDYDYAAGIEALEKFHLFVFRHKDDPETRSWMESEVIDFIRSSPRPGGLLAVCRGLRLIGSAKSVPVLEPLLLRPGTADSARFALEKIPSPEACQVLLSSLDKTSGHLKLGIISSLGELGQAAAAKPLASLTRGKNAAEAEAAVIALGKIGSEEAIASLRSLLGKNSPSRLKESAAAALLACADRLEKSGESNQAAAIYTEIQNSPVRPVMRQAAFKGKLAASGEAGRALIVKTLTGRDPLFLSPAISMIPRFFDEKSIADIIPLMNSLPGESRIELIAVLAGYSGQAVEEAIMAAASSPVLPLRLEALRSLAAGSESTVEFLAHRAAESRGPEQAAARESLARLKGAAADRAVARMLGRSLDESLTAELIRAAGERHVTEARPALMTILRSEDTPVALQLRAAAALKDLAGPSDLAELTALLLSIEEENVRETMQDTVASVARAMARPASRSSYIVRLYGEQEDPAKMACLLQVLGKIGQDSSLPLIRAALNHRDERVAGAAVRALAGWPSATARDDVFALASSSANPVYKVLAIRAFVRMIGLETYRAPDAAAADLKKVLAIASRPEEKKLILAGLAAFPGKLSLEIAESLAADPALKAEAEAAVARIEKELQRK